MPCDILIFPILICKELQNLMRVGVFVNFQPLKFPSHTVLAMIEHTLKIPRPQLQQQVPRIGFWRTTFSKMVSRN